MQRAIQLLLCVLFLPAVNADCHNSETWFKTGEPHKTCGWVADFPKRCSVKGHTTEYAFEVCHGACGNCDEPCVDSSTWYVAGNPGQGCAWVAESMSRCVEVGDDDTMGFHACRVSCNSCAASTPVEDDTTFEYTSTDYSVLFKGSRQACLQEVPMSSHCPDEFPMWEETEDTAPTCPLAIIGAGVGGLYTALRLMDTGKVMASDMCIFEATDRVGGRTYSLRYEDMNLVVDAGAYRTWPRFTPVTHALITDYLGINMTCYDPAENPCEKFIITSNVTGHNLGFTAYIEMMADKLISKGAKWFPWHYLSKIVPTGNDMLDLKFSNGATAMIPARSAANGVSGGGVILNLPQRPLLEIFRASADDLSLDASIFQAAHAVQTAVVTKLYLYYESAWWITLGLTSGDFELEGDATEMLLKGRYHDGDINCDENGECSGFLLTVYANDYAGTYAQYFRRYQRDRPEPITVISDSTVEGANFLQHAHDRLTYYHIYENVDAPYSGYDATRTLAQVGPPKFAVLATWNTAAYGSGGGWHGFLDTDYVDAMPEALSESYGIHIVNEAYSKVQSWAEGSLESADLILGNHYDVPRPWDFPAADVPLHLAQTSPFATCDGSEDSESDGGPAPAPGSGSVVDDELACFVGTALVGLTDGSMVSLQEIKTGDEIVTGFGAGVVKEVLVHPVEAEVDVIVIETPSGEVVGTRTHPVFVDGQWRELSDAADARYFEGKIRQEKRYVSAFYNLEVDGGEHAYVLNDVVVASGLGDNEELNMRFPRQNLWKQRATVTATA